MKKIALTFTFLLLILNIGLIWGAKAQNNTQALEFLKLGEISTGGDAYAMWIPSKGDLAYLTCGYSGLKIFNISTYSNPIEISHLPERPASIPSGHSTGYAHQFFMDGNIIYVGDGAAGLTIINISDPYNPQFITQYLGGYAWDVQIVDNVAFVALGWIDASLKSGLDLVNVTDPSNPVLIVDLNTQGLITDIDVEGDLLFLSDSQDGVLIYDISNPINPALVGQYDGLATGEPDYSFDVVGDFLYVVSWTEGRLHILDISDPGDILMVGGFTSSDSYISVRVFDELAYLGGEQGLTVLNISNPSNPVEIGQYSEIGRVTDVHKRDNIIFLATEASGLVIVEQELHERPTSTEDTAASSAGFDVLIVLVGVSCLLILKKMHASQTFKKIV
ncbi:MAG: LVIVD repeat-containing protein [Candidatus Heimdallarchaeota archaeon]